MLPIGDEHSGISRPAVITILLILLNIAVFVLFQGFGTNENFTYAFATVPHEILTGKDVADAVSISDPVSGDPIGKINLQPTPIPLILTLITSMFMHGGLAHLFGNMLFLWIFGDNLEHAMGSRKYLLFYLICGVAAALAQVFMTGVTNGNQYIPMVGASGAISGVLGGYIMLFPHRQITVLLGYFVTRVPAFVALGMWFAFQFISGIGILGNDSQVGGVAYAAHIGGFIAGLILVRLFSNPESLREMEQARQYTRV